MRSIMAGMTAAGLAASALAAPMAITVEKSVFRESRVTDTAGKAARVLEPASRLKRGDTVVLMLEWQGPGRAEDFTVSSRVPRDLAFRRSGAADAQLSIDGGRTWGELGALRIGQRMATPEDVTHLRWYVSDEDAAMGRGMLTYSAIVR